MKLKLGQVRIATFAFLHVKKVTEWISRFVVIKTTTFEMIITNLKILQGIFPNNSKHFCLAEWFISLNIKRFPYSAKDNKNRKKMTSRNHCLILYFQRQSFRQGMDRIMYRLLALPSNTVQSSTNWPTVHWQRHLNLRPRVRHILKRYSGQVISGELLWY